MADPFISVRATGNRPVQRAASELEKVLPLGSSAKTVIQRYRAMMENVSRRMAETMLREVKRRLPTTVSYVEYRKSLRLIRVVGTPSNAPQSFFAVQSLSKRRRATRKDNDRTLVIIEPKPRQRVEARPAWLDVLMERNPWTVDTLPLTPSPKEAHVVFLPSTISEVTKVRSTRQADEAETAKALLAVGVRLSARDKKMPLRGSPDLATFALRIEMGLAGQRGIPHWRPAQVQMRQRIEKDWTKGYWSKWIWDPKFNWKSAGPKRKVPQVSFPATVAFAPFVQKIRI